MKRKLIGVIGLVLFSSGFVLGKALGEKAGQKHLCGEKIAELKRKALLSLLKE
jgi:hypothetical protein